MFLRAATISLVHHGLFLYHSSSSFDRLFIQFRVLKKADFNVALVFQNICGNRYVLLRLRIFRGAVAFTDILHPSQDQIGLMMTQEGAGNVDNIVMIGMKTIEWQLKAARM